MDISATYNCKRIYSKVCRQSIARTVRIDLSLVLERDVI
jgi:hypothetical protein